MRFTKFGSIIGAVCVVLGGVSEAAAGGEVDGFNWKLMSASGPTPRYGHAMAYDSARGVTVLFGGNEGYDGGNGPTGDTWEWDGSEWTLRATTGPSPRWLHAMAYDSARGVTVLMGGEAPGDIQKMYETWEWDGSAWTFRGEAPFRRQEHAMAFDEARGVTVLFGGDSRPPRGPTTRGSGMGATGRSGRRPARPSAIITLWRTTAPGKSP